MRRREPAQATAELGAVALVLVVVIVGMVGVAELVQAQMALATVAEEAAHAAALSPSVDLAQEQGRERGFAVGAAYALRNGSLAVTVDSSRFEPGGRVAASAAYRLTSTEIPLLGWGSLDVSRAHVEPVPRFRSLPVP
jgi:Flp pilus assembly protein TadG